ncbi:hypothetical protein E2562_007598 [Oryza meyeriana var. granulata]|uniref:Uncharacterized protein n=1 Tax=Oryza meyeriana var. granulata TaxID=110450 RepID=A0A6G1DVH0_9ORYZ|nr:hypothetical protein E2562_007598 [Oryza meyeriana var. granulata]
MAARSDELRVTLLGLALLGLLLLSHGAAPVDATGNSRKSSFSMNAGVGVGAGGHRGNSFSMNSNERGRSGGQGVAGGH